MTDESNGDEYEVYSAQPPCSGPPITPRTAMSGGALSHGLPLLPPMYPWQLNEGTPAARCAGIVHVIGWSFRPAF